jgi:hypothetical protein
VRDASGRDSKSKSHLEPLCKGEGLFAVVRSTENEFFEWGNKESPTLRNAVSESMDAITGSTAGLVRFLIEYWCDGSHISPNIDVPGFESMARRYGYYSALIKMEANLRKSLTKHRATMKEVDICRKHGVEPAGIDVETITASIESTKKWHALTMDTMTDIVRGDIPRLVDALIRYMPTRIGHQQSPVPDVHTVGKEMRLGLVGRPVPSGAETVALAVALAATVFEPEECVYILPDRAYDDDTLESILRVLRSIPCFGAVVTSTGEAVKHLGWTTVTL